MRVLQFLLRMFRRKPRGYMIERLPVGLELSDGDKARLYGWPDRYIEELPNES